MDPVEVRANVWRASVLAETPLQLASHYPPVLRTVVARRDALGHVMRTDDGKPMLSIRDDTEPGAAVGVSLSGPMLRLLGHEDGYGLSFPTRRALYAWRKYCRRKHRRWPDHRDGPLCGDVAVAVIRDRVPVRRAAAEHGLSYFRCLAYLREATGWMSNQQEQWFERSAQ